MAATVGITCGPVDNRTAANGTSPGAQMPVPQSVPTAAQTITSSATSQQTTITGTAGQFWRVVASGGAIWVKAAADPTAAAGDDWLVPAGGVLELSVTAASEKLAVIDAA